MPTVRHYAEEQQAIALLQWARMYQHRYAGLDLLYHCPNGGRRNPREAARLKATGVKAGVPDYCLPVPMRDDIHSAWEHGLYIELKAGAGKPTASQQEWLKRLREQGYRAEVCTGWVEAARTIAKYLGLPEGVAP